MARPLFVPSEKILARAWKWKKKHKTVKEICEKINISFSQYSQNTKIFNAYFEQLRKHELHEGQIQSLKQDDSRDSYKNGGTKLIIEDIDLEVLRAYVIAGFNRDRISQLFGISRGTLVNYAKKFPSIKETLDKARDEMTSKIVEALTKRAVGYRYKEECASNYKGAVSVVTLKKYSHGDVSAQKYWLANTERWATEPQSSSSNSKGLILETLDKLAED